MSDKSNWITLERRKESQNTQLSLAKAMGVDDKQIRRWSQSEYQPTLEQFTQLSELLIINVAILIQDFKRVQKENGSYKTPVLNEKNKEQLLDVIKACHQQNVLIKTATGDANSVELRNLITDNLEKGLLKKIRREVNQTLLKDIERANANQLQAMRMFVSEVGKAAVIIENGFLVGGEKHKLFGRSPFWLVRLLIDSTLDSNHKGQLFSFCEAIKVKNGEFDSGSICHFQMSEKTVGEEDMTLYDLVLSLNEHLRPLDNIGPPPCNVENEIEFKIYCRKLNADIADTNETELHKFCMIHSSHSGSIVTTFINLFNDLRTFEFESSGEESEHVRVGDIDLGSWLVKNLGAISDRENELLNGENILEKKSEKTEITREGNEMSAITNTFNINTYDESKSEVTQSFTTQINSPQWQKFSQEFEKLSKDVQQNIDKPEYRDLRNAVRDINEEFAKSGKLPKESASWLEKSFSAISKTNSTWGLIDKTVKAIALLNGAGVG